MPSVTISDAAGPGPQAGGATCRRGSWQAVQAAVDALDVAAAEYDEHLDDQAARAWERARANLDAALEDLRRGRGGQQYRHSAQHTAYPSARRSTKAVPARRTGGPLRDPW